MSESRMLYIISIILILGVFVILALDSDRLNRRIAALECKAGMVERCGPPWNNTGAK
jgi:hypothetical protein